MGKSGNGESYKIWREILRVMALPSLGEYYAEEIATAKKEKK